MEGKGEKNDEYNQNREDMNREIDETENSEQGSHKHATWEDLVIEEEEETEKEGRTSLIRLDVLIGGKIEIQAVVGAGANHTCINKELYDRLCEDESVLGELPVSQLKLISAVGKRRIEIRKQVALELRWSDKTYVVVALVVEGLFASMILGLDWLRSNNVVINCERNALSIENIKDGKTDQDTVAKEFMSVTIGKQQ